MELTREQFVEEIKKLSVKETTFNVSSSDIGNVNLYLRGCVINVNAEEGIEGEITIFKPHTEMEVTLDFNTVNEITKQGNIYTLSFVIGIADIDIEVIQ